MNGDELIQQMKAKIFPRIRDLMVSRYNEAIADQEFVDSLARLGLDNPPEPAEPSLEALEWMLNVPLTDLAVTLLWAVAAKATEGTFISSDENVAAVVTSIDLEEVVRLTGMKEDDMPFVLKQMAESLVEIIHEHTAIDVQIDRQALRLCV